MGCNHPREEDQIGMKKNIQAASKMSHAEIEKISIKMADAAISKYDYNHNGKLDK